MLSPGYTEKADADEGNTLQDSFRCLSRYTDIISCCHRDSSAKEGGEGEEGGFGGVGGGGWWWCINNKNSSSLPMHIFLLFFVAYPHSWNHGGLQENENPELRTKHLLSQFLALVFHTSSIIFCFCLFLAFETCGWLKKNVVNICFNLLFL